MQSLINISELMIFDNRLSLGDLKVYCALVKIAAGANQCTTAKKQIAQVSGMDKVSRHTKILQSNGYISIKQNQSGDINTYFLLLVEMQPLQPVVDRLSSFMAEYLRYSTGVHSSATTRTYASCLRELIAFAGDISIKEVNIRMVEQFLAHKKKVSEYTARKHYISLKSVFERAVVWEIIPANPFKKIKIPKVAEVEVAYFSREEFQFFVSSIEDQDFRDLVLFAFYSSFRRAEIISLRWCDIDLERGVINLRNSSVFTSKNKKNRTIGINKGLHTILSRRKGMSSGDNGWVFCNSTGQPLIGDSVSKKFKKYLLKAGLNPKLRFHSTRHFSISTMLAEGTPSNAVMRYAGHQRLSTTEKYSHVSEKQLIQIANSLPVLFE